MIFKQVDEILSGRKTQTRRIVKPNERASADYSTVYRVTEVEYDDVGNIWSWDGRVKWEVGRTYAVVPKRGQPAVWWRTDTKTIETARGLSSALGEAHRYDRETYLKAEGFQPLRIRITTIRQERLQFILPAGAYMEGVESVEEYKALWESINGKSKTARWDDNPDVWVLTFELVTEN